MEKIIKGVKNMSKSISNKKIAIFCSLFFIAFLISLLSSINVFSKDIPYTDSSVFLTIGKGMNEGLTPYKDFFDHKGPLIYFINAFGWSLGKLTGVWVLEIFFLFATVIFLFKTSEILLPNRPFFSILMTFFSLVPLIVFFEGGNFTEEYAISFISLTLYYFTKYYYKHENLKIWEIILIGASFAGTLLLRPNMIAAWIVFCLAIVLKEVLEKKYKRILAFAILFIFGMLIVILPAMIYLLVRGAFVDFIQQFFVFNSRYASNGGWEVVGNNLLMILENKYVCLLLLGLSLIVAFYKTKEKNFYISILLAVILSIFIIAYSQDNYLHYYLILVPYFLIPITVLGVVFLEKLSTKKQWIEYVYLFVLLFVLCISTLIAGKNIVVSTYHSNEESGRIAAGELIKSKTKKNDKITVVGNSSVMYLYSDRESVSKYIYQSTLKMGSPAAVEEYKSDVLKNKPQAVVFTLSGNQAMIDGKQDDNSDYYNFFPDLLAKDYEEPIQVSNYMIYFKKKIS